MRSHAAKRALRALAVVLLLGLVAGCTTTVRGTASYAGGVKQTVPDADLKIEGSDGGVVDTLVANSLNDIIAYWKEHFQEDFGKEYTPLAGGIHSYTPDQSEEVPCVGAASEGANNAFYCPSGDLIAYDRDFLGQLADNFGDFIVPLVMSHEFGHFIQSRIGDPSDKSIVLETQADCFAGVFIQQTTSGTDHFQISDSDLDGVLAGYFYFRDAPGGSAAQPAAHGSGFDRLSGFQEGFEDGAQACTSNFNDDRVFTEIPFTEGDQANQGNASYENIVGLVPDEFNAFFNAIAQDGGGSWQEVQIAAITGSDPCEGTQSDESVFYCPADHTVYYNDATTKQAHEKLGDFAAVELFAIGYGEAVLDQAGVDLNDESAFNAAVCVSGGYAGDAFRLNQQGEQTLGGSTLSAGDVDEAVALLIALRSDNSVIDTFGVNAFGRVSDFRKGFDLGSEARSNISGCVD